MANPVCPNCGTEYLGIERFCRKCGAPIQQQPQQQYPPQQQYQSQSQYQSQNQYQAQQPAPVQPEPVPAPTAQTYVPVTPPYTPAKPNGQKTSAGRRAGTIILCILLVFSVFAASTTAILSGATEEDKIADLSSDLLTDEEIMELPAKDLIKTASKNLTVKEYIIEKITGKAINEVVIEDDELENYLEESNVMELFSDHIAAMSTDIREGTSDSELEKEDVWEALYEDIDLVKKYMDINMPEESIDDIVEEMETAGLFKKMDVDYIRDESGDAVAAAEILLSGDLVWVFVILSVLLAVGICLLNQFKVAPMALSLGVSFTVSGLLVAMPAILGEVITDAVGSSLKNMSFLETIIEDILELFVMPGLVIGLAGILLIVLRVVLAFLPKKAQ